MLKKTQINKNDSLFEQTEKPGALHPIDTHQVIKTRYVFASNQMIGNTVLEVGCGSGYGIDFFPKIAPNYFGGELTADNIRMIKNRDNKNFVKTAFIQMDAHALPFTQNSFDTIIALAMIYYLNFPTFINEVKKTLKPGGRLIFCSSNPSVPGFVPAPYSTLYYTLPEINKILTQENFGVKIYGAFNITRPNIYQKNMTIFRDIVKKIIYTLPHGDQIWLKLRQKKFGPYYKLPDKIEDIHTTCYKWIELDANVINKKCRVYYVVAELRYDC